MLFNFNSMALSPLVEAKLSVIVDRPLVELKKFFDHIELLKVSHLQLTGQNIRAYQLRLSELKTYPQASISSYRKFIKEIGSDFRIARLFESRRSVLAELLDDSSEGFWKLTESRLARGRGRAEFSQIKARILAQGHFSLYPVSALIELGEDYLPEVARFEKQLETLRQHLNQLRIQHTLSSDMYGYALLYTEEIRQQLMEFKATLLRSILERLETSNKHLNINDADNLVQDVQELNNLLEEAPDSTVKKLSVPGRLGQHLILSDFYRLHGIIEAHGSELAKERLNSLNWRVAGHGYVLMRTECPIKIIPEALAAFVLPRLNWFQGLFASLRYCVEFPFRYGHLWLKTKQLFAYKRGLPVDKYNLDTDEALAEFKKLERELEAAYREVEFEREIGFFAYFNPRKNNLISHFQIFIKESLKMVAMKKLDILREHAERIRTFILFGEDIDLTAEPGFNLLEIRNRYLSEPLKTQIFTLCDELNAGVERLGLDESDPWVIAFTAVQSTIRQFYVESEHPPKRKPSSTQFIEQLSDRSTLDLLGLEAAELESTLKRFSEECNHWLLHGDATEQRIALKSICHMIKHYLDYVKACIDREEAMETTKLALLETLPASLSADLSYLTDAILTLTQLRQQANTYELKLRIQCVVQEFNAVIDPLLLECARETQVAAGVDFAPRSSGSVHLPRLFQAPVREREVDDAVELTEMRPPLIRSSVTHP